MYFSRFYLKWLHDIFRLTKWVYQNQNTYLRGIHGSSNSVLHCTLNMIKYAYLRFQRFFVNFDQLYLSLFLSQNNHTYICRLPRYESTKFQIIIWRKQIDPGILQHKHGTKCKYATSEFGPPPCLKAVWGTSRPITILLKIDQIASNM